MTNFQKTVKYIAMAFAIFLTVSIIGGILSMFGLFGGFFGGDAVTEDIKTYSVSSEIQSLEVKINAADFTIKQGESFSVESNLKHLTVEDKNGVLTIEETRKFAHTYTGAILTPVSYTHLGNDKRYSDVVEISAHIYIEIRYVMTQIYNRDGKPLITA